MMSWSPSFSHDGFLPRKFKLTRDPHCLIATVLENLDVALPGSQHIPDRSLLQPVALCLPGSRWREGRR